MQHNEFKIGETFWCSGRQWRCTDIGTRTVIAMRIDSVDVGSTNPELCRTLNRAQAEAEGWFNGPPYAGVEGVFDEDYMPACSLEPDLRDDAPIVTEPDDADGEAVDAAALRMARVSAVREQASSGGLRFEAYLPSDQAGWLLDLIESGTFTDPSEAVFVMLGEQRDLEPHADLREELLNRCCQAALDDPCPRIPHEEVGAWLKRRMETPRQKPAVWPKDAP
jgi:antitoxin ParD1/3/4